MFHKRKFMIPSRQLVDHHMATNWFTVPWPIHQGYTGPCEVPDVEYFRLYFPEFEKVPDERIELLIDEAACSVDSSWVQNNCGTNDCTLAILYLAAHLLTMLLFASAALPSGGEAGVIVPGGEITGVSFETTKVTYSASKMQVDRGSAGGQAVYSYESTPYGQRYLDLLKVNHPAVLVV